MACLPTSSTVANSTQVSQSTLSPDGTPALLGVPGGGAQKHKRQTTLPFRSWGQRKAQRTARAPGPAGAERAQSITAASRRPPGGRVPRARAAPQAEGAKAALQCQQWLAAPDASPPFWAKAGDGGPQQGASAKPRCGRGSPEAVLPERTPATAAAESEQFQPGPSTRKLAAGSKSVLSVNVTALMGAAEIITSFSSDVLCIQEHAISPQWRRAAEAKFARLGYDLYASPCNPEADSVAGGVAMAFKRPLAAQVGEPRTAAFAQAVQLGRALLAITSLGRATPFIFVTAYGWAKDGEDFKRLERTSALCVAIRDELACWPKLPTIIAADLNALPEQIPSIRESMIQGQWHDIGHLGPVWGQPPDLPTARAHNSKMDSRIDCILANTEALGQINGHTNHGFGWVDVHAPLEISIRAKPPQPRPALRMAKPMPLQDTPKEAVQGAIDTAFHAAHAAFEAALAKGDTAAFYKTWTQAFQRGLWEAASRPCEREFAQSARGYVKISCKAPSWARRSVVQADSASCQASEISMHGNLLILKRSLQSLTALVNKARFAPGEQWPSQVSMLWRRCLQRASAFSPPIHLAGVREGTQGWAACVVALKLHVSDLDKRAKAEAQRATRARRAELKQRLSSKKSGIRDILKVLRAPPPAGLTAIREGESIHVDTAEIDRCAREYWGEVYAGNAPAHDKWGHAGAFMARYAHLVQPVQEFPLPRITPKEVVNVFARARQSAQGPDAWCVQDLAHMTLLSATRLIQFFDMLEEGADWPPDLVLARAIFLFKGEGDPLEAKNYRLLTITSHIYRKWAMIRLRHLSAWVQSWATDSLFAGVPGRAAHQASWLLSMELEEVKVGQSHASAMSTDIFKCFDQLSKETIFLLAARMGCPMKVLVAWHRMLSQLKVVNSVGGYVGQAYERPFSIPQGCPLSMMWLACLLTPLTKALKALGAVPRVLADDLNLLCRGPRHWRLLIRAGDCTHEYIIMMGCKISAPKSVLFSTSAEVRQHMRRHVWRFIEMAVPVKLHARDLGAHLAFGAHLAGDTLTTRMHGIIELLQRLSYLPVEARGTLDAILIKALPRALYGCESTPVQARAVGSMRASIKRALCGGTKSMGSPHLVFSTWERKNPDPLWTVLVRRAKTARDMWHATQEIRARMDNLLFELVASGSIGACVGDEPPGLVAPGFCGAVPWGCESASEVLMLGPVSLLLASLSRIAIRIDASWVLYRAHDRVTSLMQDPWAAVMQYMYRAFQQAGFQELAENRHSIEKGCHIDWHLTLRHEWSPADAGLMRSIMVGAVWSDEFAFKAGYQDSPTCSRCGHSLGGLRHILWDCPSFEPHRGTVRALLRDIQPSDLPPSLALHGLMPHLPATVGSGLCLGQKGQRAEFPHMLQALLFQAPDIQWCTMQMAADLIRGPLPAVEPFDLQVVGQAPRSPTVFTDGAVKWPQAFKYRLGGLGFNLLERDRGDLGEFRDFVHGGHLGEGQFHAPLRGPLATSARAEAMAVCVACLIPRPITIATDNMSVFVRLKKLIERAAKGTIEDPISMGQGGATWALPASRRVDADVWAQIQHLLSKRPKATAVVKVKAHLGPEAVQQGLISEEARRANAKADAMAAKGVERTGGQAVHMLSKFMRVSAIHHKVVLAIQSMQISIVRESASLYQAETRLQSNQKGVVYVRLPTCDSPDEVVEPRRVSRSLLESGAISTLHQFVFQHEWLWFQDRSMPWLLLWAIYELTSNVRVQPADGGQVSPLKVAPTQKRLLGCFRKQFMQVVRNDMHASDRARFKATTGSSSVLASLGFKGNAVTLGLWPRVPDQLLAKASLALLSARKGLPEDWKAKALEGSLLLPSVQLNLQGLAPWRAGCAERPVLRSRAGSDLRGAPYAVRCAACPNVIQLNGKPVRENTSWPKVTCTQCRDNRRCGALICVLCGEPVIRCECFYCLGQFKAAAGVQRSLRSFGVA